MLVIDQSTKDIICDSCNFPTTLGMNQVIVLKNFSIKLNDLTNVLSIKIDGIETDLTGTADFAALKTKVESTLTLVSKTYTSVETATGYLVVNGTDAMFETMTYTDGTFSFNEVV